MTLSKKLGKTIQQVSDDLPIRKITVDLGEVRFDLRVRVPLKKEMEEINARILAPTAEKIDAIYERLSAPMRKALEDGGEDFVEMLNKKSERVVATDNDLIIDGTSLRQVAQLQAMEEAKVEEYFHLLVSETNEVINETFEQITGEFPEFVVKEIVASIHGAINPDYKTAKKN